jgi:uncharacterized membrane protein
MPNLAQFHPQIVHFVIALLLVGVAMRVVSLTGKLRFTIPAGFTLLLIGTVAAWLAVRSGTDAHGPVERIPGARAAVIEHEEHGKMALNVFYVVALLEIAALAMAVRESLAKRAYWVYVASAVVGLYGAFQLYEAGEHGGELVYSYGGGPGLRTGNPADNERLLLAGLYNQAMADRRAKRSAEAAELFAMMSKRYPLDTTVQILNAESLLLDAKKPTDALTALSLVSVAPNDARLQSRIATLKADIYLSLGTPEAAKKTLADAIAALPAGAPQAARLKTKLDSIGK